MHRFLFRFAPTLAARRWLALAAVAAAAPVGAATVTALPTPAVNLITSGFEAPAVAALPGGYAYAPAGTNWTFECSTGIAAVGSAFNVPSAPQDSQVGILQAPAPNCASASRMTRSFTVTTAGRYRLSLQSAQRLTNQQRASVRIDGQEIGQFTPAGSGFERIVFDALLLQPGTHQLSFTALVTNSDQTLFLDDIRIDDIAAGSRPWSQGSTWNTGTPPAPGDEVVIPAGSSVLLGGSHSAGLISVNGELHCADANITLNAESVMVMGRFVCGAPTSPYLQQFELTLSCPAAHAGGSHANHMSMGDKVFGVMGSGIVALHGEVRTSKTQLRQSAAAGAQMLYLAGTTNWRIGDRIVVAPTRWNTQSGLTVDESETVVITSLVETSYSENGGRALGHNVGIDRPLSFPHYGLTSSYSSGGNSNDTTWKLDERAEVGLLSRNIVIQGDGTATASKYGGHMMSMDQSQVQVSGVELRRMGQSRLLGRYPFHWHLRGEAPGQYISNSSVHTSFNRCITVHGTNRVRVADNVCYDFVGHGYFLERGDEQYNVFDGNLGILARRPDENANADGCTPPLESDKREAPASNGPAVFWITNPTNTFTNNVAAGSQGAGFWYHLGRQLTCLPPAGQPQPPAMDPRYQPFGKFDNNRAYASRQGLTLCHDGGGTPGIGSPGALFERTTVSSVGQGIWPCADAWWQQNAVFDRSIVANTENGLQAPTPFTFTNSLFVGHSPNEPARAQESAETPWAAVRLYDQGFLFDNVHFANYDRRNMSAFLTINGAGKLTNNRVENLSFSNSPNIYRDLEEASAAGQSSERWGMPIHDLDGSLAGAGKAVVPGNPLLIDASCRRAAGVDGYACPYRYHQFRFDYWPSVPGKVPPPYVTQMRSDGISDSTAGMEGRYLAQVMADGPYYHSYRFDAGVPRNNLDLMLINAFDGDVSVHQFLDIPPGFRLHPQQAPGWGSVETLADLLAGSGNLYFYNWASGSLFVRMQASGNDWHAIGTLSLCMVDFVLDNGQWKCPDGAPPPPPVKTRITSPGQASAFAPVLVSAEVTTTAPGSLDVLLFLDDGPNFLPTGSTPYTFDIGLMSPGVHVIAVVARHTDAQGKVRSYTDQQRLVVGEPEPRLAMNSPAANGTYAPGAVPALSHTLHNGPTPGQQVRWFDNGIDMGVAAGSVSLNQLAPGRHDLEVALAYADGSVGSVRSQRTIYVLANGLLADFEQGPDARVILRPDRDFERRVRPFYAAGLRSTAYLDGSADDYNYYSTFYDAADGLRESSFLLQLLPTQNWSAYESLEITHMGQPFQVWLKRGNGPDLPLSPTASNLTFLATQLFGWSGADVSQVTGVELRQSAPPPPPWVNCAAVYNTNYCFVNNYISHMRLLQSGQSLVDGRE